MKTKVAEGVDTDGRSNRKPTILLVDDEPDILGAYSALFKSALDAQVVTATSGADAIDVLQETDVALIVSDYKMPEMDGLELLRRAETLAPGVPRVLVTAFVDEVLRETALREVDRFFSKGMNPPDLIAEVRDLLERP